MTEPVRRRFGLPAVALVAALAGAGAAALLVNIFEHQQEAKNPFFRVVELNDQVEDPAIWGKNFPLQYDSYRRTVDQQRTRFGGSEAVPRTPTDADPRSVVPESVMPPYIFLEKTDLRIDTIADALKANRMVGVPYTDDMVANAKADLIAQATPDGDGVDAFKKRYAKADARDFDGDPTRITEMDAVIAYMQMLGTLVDFKTYQADAPENER